MANPIVHFEIPGDDPEKLSAFYSTLFDWKIVRDPDMDYWLITIAPADANGSPTPSGRVDGGLARRIAPEQRPVNYVGVSNVDEYVARAAQLGGTVAMGKTEVPGMGFFAHVIDPEGNIFGVWESA